MLLKVYVWSLALLFSFNYISPLTYSDADVKSVKHTSFVSFDEWIQAIPLYINK